MKIELLLDYGAHLPEPGDMLMLMGVDLGWHAGPEGCVVSMKSWARQGPEARR